MKEIESGGRAEDRTLDPLIKSQLLYQLSYASAGRDYSRKSQKSHQKGATLSPLLLALANAKHIALGWEAVRVAIVA